MALAAALSVAACGAPRNSAAGGSSADSFQGASPGNSVADDNSADSFQGAFDKSFNSEFDKSAHDSCISSATAHGASPGRAERYCTCMVGQLDNLTVRQKMELRPSSPEVSQAFSACRS